MEQYQPISDHDFQTLNMTHPIILYFPIYFYIIFGAYHGKANSCMKISKTILNRMDIYKKEKGWELVHKLTFT
ncbi:hypothetical protein GCM10028868_22640 [Virgibacillus kimchii]